MWRDARQQQAAAEQPLGGRPGRDGGGAGGRPDRVGERACGPAVRVPEISLSAIDAEERLLVTAAIRDVTHRRKAAEMASRLASIVQSSHDAIMGRTRGGVITSWNPGAARLYGYPEDEILGRSGEVLCPPQRQAEEAQLLARIAAGDRVEQYQTERIRKDGTVVTVSLTLSPILDTAGQIVGVASVSREVGERQRAGGRFRGLLEAAPDAIVGVDADGRIALVNAQAERLFGYPREEMVGQPVEMLVPEVVRGLHPGHRSGYLSDPRPRPMGAGTALAGRRWDGTEFPAEISLSTLDTDDGVLIAAAVRDVTDRKKAEAKFRGLLEAAPDAIVGVGDDGRIALINTQAERLFGYGRDELVGQPVEILVPHGVRDVHPGHRSRYFADPQQRPMGADMQLAARRKDGSEFPAEISLSALDTEDGLLVSAAVRDVTERIEAQAERERLKTQSERERLEAQLHQSQRLESLGQLAGGVAHDFNNLLGAILNYASFVEEELTAAAARPGGEAWLPVGRDVEQIRRAAERATNLTHQLLAFGRRDIVQPLVLTLNDIIVEVEQLLRRSLGEHIELATALAGDLWPVLADPGQLEQVLVNLAVNARDAMPGGGSLTIDTANLLVDDDYAATRHGLKVGRHIRLRVSDTGTGMPKDVLDRVFEPFFTTKPKGEGTGLGLATIYGIITQADGHAQIYSEPGLGTTFTALLPVTDRAPTQVQPPTLTHHSRGGETVLVVEDEQAMREVTRRILARNGYQVITAASGAEAIDLAASLEQEIHLLITDVIMPQMLGKEVADRIRATRPAIRTLYMSGYAHPVLASQGTLDQGVTLIEKPFTEPALLNKIKEVLDIPD
jgi:PAS domain S-box-containing protein